MKRNRVMSLEKEKRELANRSIAIIAEKADGRVTRWDSTSLAAFALGVCSGTLHAIIESGKPYKQYTRIYKEGGDASDR